MKIRAGLGEDKALEALLLREGIYIDYFEDIHVYDLKPTTIREFNEQRGRWGYIQLHSLVNNFRYLPAALLSRRYDLADKIIQWMLVPRTMMMGFITIMSLVLPFIYFTLAIKWWVVAALAIFAFSMVTPGYVVDKHWDTDFLRAPFISIGALLNFFRAWRDEAGNRISAFSEILQSIKRRIKR